MLFSQLYPQYSRETHRSLLNRPPKTLCDLAHTVARNTVDHVLAVRHHDRLLVPLCILDSNESTGAELVNLAPRPTVQMQCDSEPFVPSSFTESQHRRIVSAHLGGSRTLWRRAVKVLQNQRCYRVDTVVDADGQYVDEECVFFRRV